MTSNSVYEECVMKLQAIVGELNTYKLILNNKWTAEEMRYINKSIDEIIVEIETTRNLIKNQNSLIL